MEVARKVVRLSVLMAAICLLVSNAIRIRGANSIIYEPSNPSNNGLTCEDDLGQKINDPTWTRDNGVIEASFIENGRLILEERTIGTDDPQNFEDRYRCHSNGDRSDELLFYVLPSRLQLSTPIVSRQLEEENVTIECPLRFGNLRDGWNVQWTVQDSQSNRLSPSGYVIQSNPKFQLVIKKATIDYDGAKFQCQAIRDDALVDSQFVSLGLFHQPEITSGPSDPVVVNLAHGIVNYEIKAYPRPSIRFCYNDTCIEAGRHDRIQITNHQNNGTSHTAQFTINSMTEADNGNVTLELNHTKTNFVKNYTAMLFLPYKMRLTKNGSIANKQVPLLITLRSPLHFQYQIEFVDMEHNSLGTMEGMKGQTSFMHMLRVERDTDVMARFRIGEVSGPDSDPVTVDVENPETTEDNNNNNVVFIVVAVLVAVVLLATIAAVTYLIKARLNRRKDRNNSPHNAESGTRRDKENDEVRVQPPVLTQNEIAMNPINPQPNIAVFAPTPGNHLPEMYPQGPMFARPLFGSNSSSIPSRKSSAGYESATGSFHCSCSPYAANHYPPPRCCHYEHDHCCTPVPQHQQHHHQQQQQERLDEHDNPELINSQQQPAATTNLSNPKPQMRRNLSDPNISRHKHSPSRSLQQDQRTKKLLSSSSVV